MAYSATLGVHNATPAGESDTWGEGDVSRWRAPTPFHSTTTWQPRVGLAAGEAAERAADPDEDTTAAAVGTERSARLSNSVF